MNIGACSSNGANSTNIRLIRGSTNIGGGTQVSNRQSAFARGIPGINNDHPNGISGHFLDSPNTTSATTYKLQVASESAGTVEINRSVNNTDSTGVYASIPSTNLTLMEIKG